LHLSVLLTTIHPHLAVQSQMCVIAQLPHVPLLTTTVRQGGPTSLWKCMFRNIEECKRIYGLKGDIRCVLDRGLLRGRSVNSLRLLRRLLLCVLWTFTLDCKQVAHQQRRRPRFKRIVFSIFHRLPSAKPEVFFEPAHSDVSSRCRSEAIPCHPFATQQFWCRKRKAKASAVSLAMRQKCLSETK